MNITQTQTDIANEIMAERNRQDSNVASGRLPWNCAAPLVTDEQKLPVLVEEVGEVAKEVYELSIGKRLDRYQLRTELIQAAAVCVAWLEALPPDSRTGGKYPPHKPSADTMEEAAA